MDNDSYQCDVDDNETLQFPLPPYVELLSEEKPRQDG